MNYHKESSIETKDILIANKFKRSLLIQQTQVLDKLFSTYQHLQQQISKHQQLLTYKSQLEKVKLKINNEEDTDSFKMKKKLKELQEQCCQKEKQLANVKKETLKNAANNRNALSQCQNLRKLIKQKEEQHQRLLAVKKERILSSNQTQVFLKKINFQIKQQHLKKLSLKQNLAKIREQGIEIRSLNDIQAQINSLELQRTKMESIICELRDCV